MWRTAPQHVGGAVFSREPPFVHIYVVLPIFVPNPVFDGLEFGGEQLSFREWFPSAFEVLKSNEKSYSANCGVELPSFIPKIAEVNKEMEDVFVQIATRPKQYILVSESGIGAFKIKTAFKGFHNLGKVIKILESLKKEVPRQLNDLYPNYRKGEWQILMMVSDKRDTIGVFEQTLQNRWHSVKLEAINNKTWIYSGNGLYVVAMKEMKSKNFQKVRTLLLNAFVHGKVSCLVARYFGVIHKHISDEGQWQVFMHWLNPWIIGGYIGRKSPYWGIYLQTIKQIIGHGKCDEAFKGNVIGYINTHQLDEKTILIARAAYTIPFDKRSRYIPLIASPSDQKTSGNKPISEKIISILYEQANQYVKGEELTPFLTVSKICVKLGDKKRRKTSEVRENLDNLTHLGYLRKKKYVGSGSRSNSYQYALKTIDEDQKQLIIKYFEDLLIKGE